MTKEFHWHIQSNLIFSLIKLFIYISNIGKRVNIYIKYMTHTHIYIYIYIYSLDPLEVRFLELRYQWFTSFTNHGS
jgi:hypothetical protein